VAVRTTPAIEDCAAAEKGMKRGRRARDYAAEKTSSRHLISPEAADEAGV
jgi:hypothetical protein